MTSTVFQIAEAAKAVTGQAHTHLPVFMTHTLTVTQATLILAELFTRCGESGSSPTGARSSQLINSCTGAHEHRAADSQLWLLVSSSLLISGLVLHALNIRTHQREARLIEQFQS